MLRHLKQTLSALLIVTVMAPGFYFGIAPTQKVSAQTDIMNNILSAGAGALSTMFVCKYGGNVLNNLVSGVGSLLGLSDAFEIDTLGGLVGTFTNIVGAVVATPSVPTNETNSSVLDPLANIDATTGAQLDISADMEFKECVLDPLLWAAKTVFIQVITEAITGWIGNGFDGGMPMFTVDPKQYLKSVADIALNEFITNSGVEQWICDPFEVEVIHSVTQIATEPTYTNFGSNSCKLDDMFSGITGGNKGNTGYAHMVEDGNISFEGGGLAVAMQLVDSGNNGYDAFFALQGAAAEKVGSAVANEATMLNYGDGFFSDRCDVGGQTVACTPGQFISKQIDDWAGGGLSQLEAADEIAEVINALFATLVQEVFSDPKLNGLMGAVSAVTAGLGDARAQGIVK
jgi:hypothetical protein